MQLDQILSFLFIISSIYVASHLLTFRFDKKERILVYLYPLTLHLFLSIYARLYFNESALSLFPLFISIIYLIALQVSFKERLSIKIFIFLYGVFSIMSIGTVTRAMLFQNWPLGAVVGLALIFSIAFLSLNYWITGPQRYKFTELKLVITNRQWFFFSSFLFFNIAYLQISRTNIDSYVLIFIISFQFLLLLYFIFLLYGYGAALMDFNMQEQMYRQLNIQKDYAKHFMIKNDEFRRLKHDFRFHLNTISQLIHDDHREDALDYIHELSATIDAFDTIFFCTNTYANAIFSTYYHLCKDEDIQFKTKLDIQDITFSNIDLSIILNNALSNAYEACLKVDGRREIDILANMNHSFLAIRIMNTFNGEVLTEDETIISTKNERGHGIGLQSIRSIVEKYHGDMDYSFNEHNFILEILINIKDGRYD